MPSRCVARRGARFKTVPANTNGFCVILKHTNPFCVTPKINELVQRTPLALLECHAPGLKWCSVVESCMMRMRRVGSVVYLIVRVLGSLGLYHLRNSQPLPAFVPYYLALAAGWDAVMPASSALEYWG
ncbi:hypothetical protein F9C07_6019 [Aspergillus flavus]|uniref:Uncharacterized protein n=1 Tax=Aspergillus flavus (strain ATCC 200026 / FGSC A1120 / IAM 13836 / NRRL 3357 / JCM 12722 / SRRC 167) TaxID=332952 RepID=A0A7U2R122_ASPFN|nr:hypothetical protein F9C07_6019 [Aspergillus flavus]